MELPLTRLTARSPAQVPRDHLFHNATLLDLDRCFLAVEVVTIAVDPHLPLPVLAEHSPGNFAVFEGPHQSGLSRSHEQTRLIRRVHVENHTRPSVEDGVKPSRVGPYKLGTVDDGRPPQQESLRPSELVRCFPLEVIYAFLVHYWGWDVIHASVVVGVEFSRKRVKRGKSKRALLRSCAIVSYDDSHSYLS